MRWILIALTGAYYLIHSMGFAKSFGYAVLPQLTADLPRMGSRMARCGPARYDERTDVRRRRSQLLDTERLASWCPRR